jgi:hypothetical protein
MKLRSKLQNFIHKKGNSNGRKGMGMELALLVLFVVFACSILLVSAAMLGTSNLNDRKDRMAQRFTLDRLAEQAMSAKQSVEHENYAVYWRENNSWTLNGLTVADPGFAPDANLVITDKEGNILLTVSWAGGEITRWEYH